MDLPHNTFISVGLFIYIDKKSAIGLHCIAIRQFKNCFCINFLVCCRISKFKNADLKRLEMDFYGWATELLFPSVFVCVGTD